MDQRKGARDIEIRGRGHRKDDRAEGLMQKNGRKDWKKRKR